MTTLPHTTLSQLEVDVLAAAPVLVGHRHDGMFNRLVCHLNVIRLARVFDAEPHFLWEVGTAGDNVGHGYAGVSPRSSTTSA